MQIRVPRLSRSIYKTWVHMTNHIKTQMDTSLTSRGRKRMWLRNAALVFLEHNSKVR